MLIFVEGIDKAGKSTFAKQLAAASGIALYRKSMPRGLGVEHHHQYFKGIGYALLELHNRFRFTAIVERSFISDWVYTNRERDTVDFSIWKEWECVDSTRAIVVIYFHIPKDEFLKRIGRAPDPYMAPTDHDRFVMLYESYLARTIFPVIRIDGRGIVSDQFGTLRNGAASCGLIDQAPQLRELR